jgi:hypothetical protein
VLEDHAVATLGVAPRYGARFVANHVTGAAFEALLVIEQDAAIVGGYEQLCRTRPHACLGSATLANLSVDGDVGVVRHPKIDGFHTIVETQRCLRSLLQKVRYGHMLQLRAQPGIRRTLDIAAWARLVSKPCTPALAGLLG